MTRQQENTSRVKKPYQKPEIVYEKKLEVISAQCGSGFGGLSGCKKVVPCVRLKQ
jgi:hypothetical protein